MKHVTAIPGVLSGLLAFGWAVGQPASPTPELRPVDSAVEDVSPLRTTLYDVRLDPRQASGFERVYTTDALPGRFVRIDGAVWAVFPQSVYVPTRRGLEAIVPENTVFYIGGPPPAALGPAPDVPPGSELRVSGRVSSRVVAGGLAEAGLAALGDGADASPRRRTVDVPASRATVWSSPLYRQLRLRALIAGAAPAIRAR